MAINTGETMMLCELCGGLRGPLAHCECETVRSQTMASKEFKVGERVVAYDGGLRYRVTIQDDWLGSGTYTVKLDDGMIINVHRKQLRRLCPKKPRREIYFETGEDGEAYSNFGQICSIFVGLKRGERVTFREVRKKASAK